ncbi:novobiocin biosynthesis protein NovU/D-mycarose 3-C-methyltransferase [Nonomuraea thailandensis]|uniref:Novobiocin biosynthesis protein NovU/D-mycarose 3-C-methyltransferase n=1 Tax=Nonomuraea thailandensis TaxID=1188745 RepID=A0A9X2GHV0_9ACTN|nr:class I SAM-dependent methyltransferase [Nonomuraea thailandensis]MCP2357814.1 novobiocin biosynthesis protein NovU/D-mycarose 3-C-methyltransferase [Nonomuraea thailandensis]
MQDIVRRLDTCRVCGGDDWLEVTSFGPVPLANGFLDPGDLPAHEPAYPVDVIVCRGCRLMAIRHVIEPGVLFRHYVYVTSESDQMIDHMRRIVGWCERRAGLAPGDLVVELGSNVGLQLAMFQERGQRVVGVDPAENLAAIANARGVRTLPEFFGGEQGRRVAAEQGQAKLVLGRQCFAHIDDVHNVLDGVTAVLAPDGVLAIEVPYLVDLLQENQFDTIYHEHLSYYSVHTLGRLFESHGLRLIDVERAAVHGGSVVVFAARADAERAPEQVVARLHSLERQLGLEDDEVYLDFAARAHEVIGQVRDLVRGLAAEGKVVAGYGAPSKGTTLLQFCGLGPEDLLFCSDTTSLKHGRLLPGTRIPVLSPEQARAEQPDYYLLLAWNYAAEILSKEEDFLRRGGRFIIPIPQPRVVAAQPAAAVA